MTYNVGNFSTCDKPCDGYAALTMTSAIALAFSPRSRCLAYRRVMAAVACRKPV